MSRKSKRLQARVAMLERQHRATSALLNEERIKCKRLKLHLRDNGRALDRCEQELRRICRVEPDPYLAEPRACIQMCLTQSEWKELKANPGFAEHLAAIYVRRLSDELRSLRRPEGARL